MPATEGASVNKPRRKEEEPHQESKQLVGGARPGRMWTLDANLLTGAERRVSG